MRLFIDDERRAPEGYTDLAVTTEMAIAMLERARRENDPLELVSFDYDAHSHLNWTFTSVAEWMRDNDFWPAEIRIHTYNSWIGRPWYEHFFTMHAPASTLVDTTDPWTFLVLNEYFKSDRPRPQWVTEFEKSLEH